MLLVVLTAVSLGATPGQPKLALMNLTGAGVEAQRAEVWGDYFAEQLTQHGLQVTTPSAMAAVLGLERQKQLMGCSEAGTSCLAEVGNALGVDGLVTGSVARGEKGGFVISLRVLSSLNGETWVSDSGRAANEDELLDFLQQRAKRFAAVVHTRLGRTAPERAGNPIRLVGWASVATGGAAAVAAAVCFGFSKSNEAALRSPATTLTSYEQAAEVAASGRGLQTASGVLTGVAVVAAGTGVVLLLTQRDAPVAVFGAPLTSGGALVTVGGTFP